MRAMNQSNEPEAEIYKNTLLINSNCIIKQCNAFVKHGNKERTGRFYLRKEEHEKLLAENGSYIFVVNGENWTAIAIVKAKDIKTPEKVSSPTWTNIFKRLFKNNNTKDNIIVVLNNDFYNRGGYNE